MLTRVIHDMLYSQRLSLLEILTPAERADVLSGTNSIDLSPKIQTWITNAPEGALLDASMMFGSVVWGTKIFNCARKNVKLVMCNLTIGMNFNLHRFTMPSQLWWHMENCRIYTTHTIVTLNSGDDSYQLIPGMIGTYYAEGTGVCAPADNQLVVDATSYENAIVGADVYIPGVLAYAVIQHNVSSSIASSGHVSFGFGSDVSNTIEGSLIYLKIDSEILRGLVTSGTFNTNVAGGGRAMHGTAAAAHSNGATATLMMAQINKIYSKSAPNTLNLASNVFSAVNGQIYIGTKDCRLTGSFHVDGGWTRPGPAAQVYCCVGAQMAVGFRMEGNITLERAMTAVGVLHGCRDAYYQITRGEGAGYPAGGLGGTFWYFGANYFCHFEAQHLRDGNIGFVDDDKSSGVGVFGLDMPNDGCTCNIGKIDSHRQGIDVTAGRRNSYKAGFVQASENAIGSFGSAPQTVTTIGAAFNEVSIGWDYEGTGVAGNALTSNNFSIDGHAGRQVEATFNLVSNLACGASATTSISNVPVTGAEVGDKVSVHIQNALATGLTIDGYVSGAGLVALRVVNASTGSQNLLTTDTLKIVAEGSFA